MKTDAHVHIGFYARAGKDDPFYYSPRRVLGVINRCGVCEFIVSSTCAHIEEIGIEEFIREAREMKRIAGWRAHEFFWLSGHLYDEDPDMLWLQTGLFDGIKLHEGETPWLTKRISDLHAILAFAARHDLPVMLHSGPNDGMRPKELATIAKSHPSVRFNFAHCRPMEEMADVIAECPNVWTDTAYMETYEYAHLSEFNWHGRLMFGTDLPVWQVHEVVCLTKRYREQQNAFMSTGLECKATFAFRNFISGNSTMH